MKKVNRSKGLSKAQYQPNRQKPSANKIGPIVLILQLKSTSDAVQMNDQSGRNLGNNNSNVIIVKDAAVSQIKPMLTVDAPLRPTKFTVTADSTGGGAVAATVAIFNNATFLPDSTDAVTAFTYSDGWTGKYMDLMLSQAGVEGITCYGFNVSCADQNGVANSAAINAMLASMRYYTGFGTNYVPASFDLNGLERKTDQKSGLETVKVKFNINALSQFVYSQPVNRVFQFTFFFQDFSL
jgi:hypothetical protein